MTQEPKKLINLSVHESADPSQISSNPNQEVAGDLNDLNDSVHDDENVDVPIPGLSDTASDETLVDRKITIANMGGG